MSSDNAASAMIFWNQDLRPDLAVCVETIENFKARGMRRVYGRGDRFNNRTSNLDLWKTKDGRLLAKFWSRGQEVDWESWEVIRVDQVDYPYADERWVPQCLRQRYNSWVLSNV